MEIISTDCDCPRRAFKCSHAAALFIHGIQNMSQTDVEYQWKKVENPRAACDLFPATKAYSVLSREPTSEDRECLYKELVAYGRFTAMGWIMRP